MGTPLRISEELVVQAKVEGEVMDRSATSQLEHWARLGRAVEAVLGHAHVSELKRRGAALSLERVLSELQGEGVQKEALRHLKALKQPRYGEDPDRPGVLVRVDADGHRTRGRFVNRVFVPEGE